MARLNWPLIKQTCGKLLLLESSFMAIATVVSAYYNWILGEKDMTALVIPTILCALTGLICLKMAGKNVSQHVTHREGYLIVSSMWIIFSIFGMMPFLIFGTCSSLCDAFLETMSGFTTTGCTVLNDIDQQPHGILLWRSLTQWIGGLGIVVFSLALLPKIETGNVQMFSAEVTGMSVDKLRPKIQDTSRRLWFIYIGLTATCCLLYIAGGMSVFDGINHAFTTLATGGFSTHQASIGWFQSSFIEYVCVIFLFLASINFSIYYLLQRGLFSYIWRNEELRWFCYIVLIFTLIFTVFFYTQSDPEFLTTEQVESMPLGFWTRLRSALFHVVTIISTCGFQGEYYDYQLWGPVFWLPTLFIMACGGCAGSTAGGFKVLRLVILIKNFRSIIKQTVVPYRVNTVMLDGHALRSEFLQRTLSFIFVFFFVSLFCMAILTLQGLDLDTALGTTISAIGNCGPGLGKTGPAFTWANLPDLSKWVLSLTMLIGRLEIFTFIVLFTRYYWKK